VPEPATTVVLSHFQTHALVSDFAAGGQTAELSPDLGLSTVLVALTPAGVVLPGEILVTWLSVQEIDEATNTKLRVTFGAIARVVGDEPSSDKTAST